MNKERQSHISSHSAKVAAEKPVHTYWQDFPAGETVTLDGGKIYCYRYYASPTLEEGMTIRAVRVNIRRGKSKTVGIKLYREEDSRIVLNVVFDEPFYLLVIGTDVATILPNALTGEDYRLMRMEGGVYVNSRREGTEFLEAEDLTIFAANRHADGVLLIAGGRVLMQHWKKAMNNPLLYNALSHINTAVDAKVYGDDFFILLRDGTQINTTTLEVTRHCSRLTRYAWIEQEAASKE